MKIYQLKKNLVNAGFFTALVSLILFLNLKPMFNFAQNAPSGTFFPLIHNNVQDYYLYLSVITQGANGQFIATDSFSTENFNGSLIFSFFIILGKASSLLGLSNIQTYHLSRIFFALLYLGTAFYLMHKIKLPYPKLAFLFFLFTGPLMTSFPFAFKAESEPFMQWWTGNDPIRRAVYLPHHMAGMFLLVCLTSLLISFMKKPGLFKITCLTLLGFFSAIIHPPSFLTFTIASFSSLVVYSLLNKPSSLFKIKNITVFSSLILVSLSLIVFINSQTRGFPWDRIDSWPSGIKYQYEVLPHYLYSLGILLPLALVGSLYSIKSRRFDLIFISCALLLPIAVIPLSNLINISNVRFIQGSPFFFLACLAVLGIQALFGFFDDSLKKAGVRYPSKWPRLFIILVFLIFSIYSSDQIFSGIRQQNEEFKPFYGNVYIDENLKTAFNFINREISGKGNILCTAQSGNFIPAFTYTVSFTGHQSYTFDIAQKNRIADEFFSGIMPLNEAEKLIMNNNIDLVFQGPFEMGYNNGILYSDILKIVFENTSVRLYALK